MPADDLLVTGVLALWSTGWAAGCAPGAVLAGGLMAAPLVWAGVVSAKAAKDTLISIAAPVKSTCFIQNLHHCFATGLTTAFSENLVYGKTRKADSEPAQSRLLDGPTKPAGAAAVLLPRGRHRPRHLSRHTQRAVADAIVAPRPVERGIAKHDSFW